MASACTHKFRHDEWYLAMLLDFNDKQLTGPHLLEGQEALQHVLQRMVTAANASGDCICRLRLEARSPTPLMCKLKQQQHVLQWSALMTASTH